MTNKPSPVSTRTPRKQWEHGTSWGYERGCRCDLCRRARKVKFHKQALKRSRAGGRLLVPAGESQRKLCEILAAGWTQYRVGLETGLTPLTVRQIAFGRRVSVQSRTVVAIDRLWCDICPKVKQKRDVSLWPIPVLKRKILDSGQAVSKHGEGQRRYLSRTSSMSSKRAEEMAVLWGFLPWEVWNGYPR